MASTDQLQSLLITRLVYRLYNRVFTNTGYRVITATTGYRAYQPGTGYTALPHQNRLQSPPSPFNSVDSGAGRCGSIYKEMFQPTGYRVHRPGAGLHSLYFYSSLLVLCRLQRITGYSELPVTETWYLTELPKVILVTENS